MGCIKWALLKKRWRKYIKNKKDKNEGKLRFNNQLCKIMQQNKLCWVGWRNQQILQGMQNPCKTSMSNKFQNFKYRIWICNLLNVFLKPNSKPYWSLWSSGYNRWKKNTFRNKTHTIIQEKRKKQSDSRFGIYPRHAVECLQIRWNTSTVGIQFHEFCEHF